MAHTFNPSTWESHAFNLNTKEVETGRDMAGWRDKYKVGGDRSSWYSVWEFMERESSPLLCEDFVEVKCFSSGWLIYFSDLSAFTPIWLWVFIIKTNCDIYGITTWGQNFHIKPEMALKRILNTQKQSQTQLLGNSFFFGGGLCLLVAHRGNDPLTDGFLTQY